MLNVGVHVTSLCHVVTLSNSEDFECVSETSNYREFNMLSLSSPLVELVVHLVGSTLVAYSKLNVAYVQHVMYIRINVKTNCNHVVLLRF